MQYTTDAKVRVECTYSTLEGSRPLQYTGVCSSIVALVQRHVHIAIYLLHAGYIIYNSPCSRAGNFPRPGQAAQEIFQEARPPLPDLDARVIMPLNIFLHIPAETLVQKAGGRMSPPASTNSNISARVRRVQARRSLVKIALYTQV